MRLARRGHQVLLLEQRPDPTARQADRSIQLSLSPRGRHALLALGLEDAVEREGIPLYYRAFHLRNGSLDLRTFPDPSWHLHAFERSALTQMVLSIAEAERNVTTHFGYQCVHVRRNPRSVVCRTPDGRLVTLEADLVIGADGTGSVVRAALVRDPSVRFSKTRSPHGYQEWKISLAFATAALDAPAPHIWPRSRWFLVSFPARSGRHYGTFVARHETWERLRANQTLASALQEDFADVVPHLRLPLEAITSKALLPVPVIRCESWTNGTDLLILGDAAHATAPFMGQGVNLALEDAIRLGDYFETYQDDLPTLLQAYEAERMPEGLACCDLSARAGHTLLQPPPDGDFTLSPLARLNFLGHRYQDVAKSEMPGWQPTVEVRPTIEPRPVRFDLPNELRVRMEFQPGERLTQAEQPADALYYVERGQVSIEQSNERLHLRAPVLVGEQGWFLGTRTATVQATTRCVVSRVGFEELESFLTREPTQGVALARGLATLALARMRRGLSTSPRYCVLLAPEEGEDAFIRWTLHHREALMQRHLSTSRALAPVLRRESNLPVSLEIFGDLCQIGRTLDRLTVDGQLEMVIVFSEGLGDRLMAYLSQDTATRLRTPSEVHRDWSNSDHTTSQPEEVNEDG